MKTTVIIGTRPEAIKMAPVIHALRTIPSMTVEVLSTGQHKDLLDGVLEVFDLKADSSLGIMHPGQTLATLTAKAISEVEAFLTHSRPSMVLVHGDTTTAMASGLAAFYLGIPVGHVEAGLRTRNLASPFPEEMNRQLLARISSLNFAPTAGALENLKYEGVSEASIHVTGNTAVDSCRWVHEKFLADSEWAESELASLYSSIGIRDTFADIVLITLHRRENQGSNFESILEAIKEVAAEHPQVNFIFPVHPNPIIREIAFGRLGGLANVYLCRPLGYLEFSLLLSRCRLAISDSGGLQEEGATFGKTVLVARSSTERPEGVETGHLKLVGSDFPLIVESSRKILGNRKSPSNVLNLDSNPYGQGRAGDLIAQSVSQYLSG